jgi:hypothetical protein
MVVVLKVRTERRGDETTKGRIGGRGEEKREELEDDGYCFCSYGSGR